MNIHPKQLIRFKEDNAKELGISTGDHLRMSSGLQFGLRTRDLIERPIVVTLRSVIGRPPENVLKVLD
ncbi:MAG: hypothetical protein Ct9H300mP28_12680 [Pseudomonadota bacterium]|nr:MAG: hypothetical protein Ct9H300mP28_12680 [Pseudomonadota bacterium]